MPWLFNEDAALKAKLQGLTVADANAPVSGRPVPVRFRFPETEVANISYPMVVIEHAGLERDAEREHRAGLTPLGYSPEGSPELATTDVTKMPYWVQDYPIPYNMDYQVVVYARKANHIMQLTGALAAMDRLPHRFGYLEIPEDGTIRRIDLIGGPDPTDTLDQDGKRLFRRTYLIRVSSELLQSQVYDFTNSTVKTVNLTLKYKDFYSDTYDIA
jgi:hypothetical protein